MQKGAEALAKQRLVAIVVLFIIGGSALTGATPVSAKEARLLQPSVGSLVEPEGLTVDQESHDLYVIDGRSEQQQITISATAGNFKVKLGGEERELPFNAGSEQVRDALREIVCGGVAETCLIVDGGPGDAAGSRPYVVGFGGDLATTDVGQLECVNASVPLSGGSGCTVTTTIPGVNGHVNRYHSDGTPANFSALGSNVIDGRGPGSDQTPQEGFRFPNPTNRVQVVVDESGGETDGDIYITQLFDHVVDVFSPSGEYLGQLSEYKEGVLSNPLNSTCGVAVDGGGDVYVADLSASIHKYDPTGSPVTNADSIANFPLPATCALASGAGSTTGLLFANQFSGGLTKLDAASGAEICEISTGNSTVAVDPTSGHVFTAAGSDVREYDASGAGCASLLRTFPAGSTVKAIGVDGTTGSGGTVYVARAGSSHLDVYGPLVKLPDVVTEPPSEIKGTTATLHGTIGADSGPAATCEFQYLTETAYLAQVAQAEGEGKNPTEIAEAAFAGASSAPCEPGGPFNGSAVNEVSAKATGLLVAGRYEYRIVGENANGKSVGEPESLETAGPPQLKGGSASEITTDSAKISAEINPSTLPTSFAVEYVTEATYQKDIAELGPGHGFDHATTAPVPAQEIGSAGSFIEVSQLLKDLVPDTAYRFRLKASNEAGTTIEAPGHRFATFPSPTGLLDARAYEQVSPATKLGEVFPPEPGPRLGLGSTCQACVPGWDKQKAPMQVSPDGDAVSYNGGPFTGGLAAGANEYVARRGGSGWQTAALSTPQLRDIEQQGFKAFSPDLTRSVLYQIKPSLTPEAPTDFANLYLAQEGKAGLETLITVQPPSRSAGYEGPNRLRLDYAGANAGSATAAPFSHVIFQANDALTEEAGGIAPKAPPVAAGETNLYEWSAGELRLINVLPGNATAAPNATIGSGLLMAKGGENFDFDHAISDDASRIFWSEKPSGQVYVREGGATTTKILDPGKFLTATPDGSKVLLNDGCLYDLEAEECEDLTLDQSQVHQGGFEGMAGASEDLSRVYFVASKALTPASEVNANPAGPEHAEDGEFNLYLWEEGTTRFIGILLEEDNANGSIGPWHAAAANRLAQASADGRFLAFESRASLTGYDNRIRVGNGCVGAGKQGLPQCFQVFEYDAENGSLACPSCNPSGERPLGQSNLSLIAGNNEFFSQPDNLPPNGGGRLFFESQDTLSPADTNGHIQDVYEWEPEGVGTCERPGGCLELISSGHSPRDSHFVNASPSGDNIFFTTRDALVLQDKDGDFMDLYDARVEGGIPFEPVIKCLNAETCKGPGTAPPSDPTAGTPGFVGPPNPIYCKKGFVKKHGKCVRKPKASKGKGHKNKKKQHKGSAKHKTGGSK